MTPPPICLDGVTLSHDGVVAVDTLSGCFEPGSLTAIVGPNGAGKTTLLRAIAGLHKPDRGSIEPRRIQAMAGLLPQSSALDRSFPVTCHDLVALGHWRRMGAFRALSRAQDDAAVAALGAVGLDGFGSRLVGDLSAGQFQRVLFARLIVQDAPVLLLDEPFNAVDERTEADLLRLIAAWRAEGRTVVVVLHDLDLVREAFPQTLLLARELVAWGPTETALAATNRRRARLAMDVWTDEPAPRRSAA